MSIHSKIGLRCVFRKLNGGVLQGQLLFHIFSTDINKGTESSLGKFAGETKLSGADDTPERWDAIQRDLDKLGKAGNVMRFNKARSKVLCLGCGSRHYQYKLLNE